VYVFFALKVCWDGTGWDEMMERVLYRYLYFGIPRCGSGKMEDARGEVFVVR
jgi:hypothetical protein